MLGLGPLLKQWGKKVTPKCAASEQTLVLRSVNADASWIGLIHASVFGLTGEELLGGLNAA